MCLTFAWLADTGGYFFGRFLGKRKLYEAVSPKKTRAGFVGALIGAEVGGLLGHFLYLRSIPLEHVVPLALVAGALGQCGDLVESLLKRSTGIKDSGSIVPGHGGMLDRIDALIIVAPVVYLYTLWVGVGR
jgi:phosphatidate cytidylyltransferase